MDFKWDESAKQYSLWCEVLPEARIGTMQEIEPGLWKCCPQWQAHFRFGVQYAEIRAGSKEEAAAIWLAVEST